MFFRLKKSGERSYIQIVENKRVDGAVTIRHRQSGPRRRTCRFRRIGLAACLGSQVH